MNKEKTAFPVDGQLLMILPRAGASFRNPDVQLPIFRADADGYYLEMRVVGDPNDKWEVAVTRRVPLENVSADEWEEFSCQYANLDLKACTDQGISKGLEKIQDRRVRALVHGVADIFKYKTGCHCVVPVQASERAGKRSSGFFSFQ